MILVTICIVSIIVSTICIATVTYEYKGLQIMNITMMLYLASIATITLGSSILYRELEFSLTLTIVYAVIWMVLSCIINMVKKRMHKR